MKRISIYKLLAGIALSACAVFCCITGIKLFTNNSAPQKAYAAVGDDSLSVSESPMPFLIESSEYVYPTVKVTVGKNIANEFGEKSVIESDYTVTKWRTLTGVVSPWQSVAAYIFYERWKTIKFFAMVRVKSVSTFTSFGSQKNTWRAMRNNQVDFDFYYDSEISVSDYSYGGRILFLDNFKFFDCNDTDYYYFPCVFSIYVVERNNYTLTAGDNWGVISDDVTVTSVSNDYVKLNVSEYAKEALKFSSFDSVSDLNTNRLKLLYKIAGYTVPSGKTSVTLQYRTETADGSGCVSQSTSQYKTAVLIDSLHAFSKTYAWNQFSIAKGIKGISDFNVVSTEKSYDSNDPDSSWTKWERPLLTARGYSYTYDPKTNRGVITIEYEQFQAQSFVIQMQNKVNRNTVLYIQSTDITKANNKTIMRFSTGRIQTMLANNVNWNVVETNYKNLIINVPDGIRDRVQIYTTESNDVVTSVVVETSDPDLLQYCSVYLPVYEDKTFDYVVTMKFKALSFNRNTRKIELINKHALFHYDISSNDIARLSVKNILNGTGVMADTGNGSYDTLLEESIAPSFLGGVEYLSINENSPVEIETHSDASSPWAYVTIPYSVNPLFVISDVDASGVNKTEYPRFKIVSATTTSYSGSYFTGDYNGERVTGITCGVSGLMREEKNGDIVKNWKFDFNTEYPEDNQIPITITYSDKLKLKITYLQNYFSAKLDNGKTPTGFAKKCVISFDETSATPLSSTAFANIYKPTADELVSVLGFSSVDDLTVIGSFGAVDLANTKVVYDDDTKGYDMTLAYCATSVKKTGSSGASDFFNVSLTCFSDWKKNFNSDWSIQVLNTENKVVFASQADIAESDLYGYFFTSVFSEKVTSLDSLFSCFGSGGCRSFYEMKEIKGSDIYKLCRAQPWLFPVAGGFVGGVIGLFVGHPVIGAGVGAAVGAAAEFAVVSIDEFFGNAGTYYTYFSFIDGTSSLPFTSRNGANDYFNNKSATENKVDEINENIKNLLTGDTYIRKVLVLIGGVLVVLVLVSVVLKFVPVWQKYAARIRENKGTRTKDDKK